MTICIGLLLRKQSFQLESPLVLENSYEDLHLSILLKEQFSSRISSSPVNSYDDLHLSTFLEKNMLI